MKKTQEQVSIVNSHIQEASKKLHDMESYYYNISVGKNARKRHGSDGEFSNTGPCKNSNAKSSYRKSIKISPFFNGTASGGLLGMTPTKKPSNSIDFEANNDSYFTKSTKNLYDSSHELHYELGYIGCCRSKFFCF